MPLAHNRGIYMSVGRSDIRPPSLGLRPVALPLKCDANLRVGRERPSTSLVGPHSERDSGPEVQAAQSFLAGADQNNAQRLACYSR